MGVLIDIADTIEQQVFSKLSMINELKRYQVQEYFKNNNIQLSRLASERSTHQAINELINNFSNKQQWQNLLDKYDGRYKSLLSAFGWYDFFIISAKGTIVYSVARESDLGQKIPTDLKSSSFFQAFNLAQQSNSSEIQFGDFAPYSPSNDDPAAFLAQPLLKSDGHQALFVALQLPL
mgnify:CR=1 FL=1